MAATASESIPPMNNEPLKTSVTDSASQPSSPQDQTEAIIRQVEHYFSDTNLAQDAHLLGLLEEGDGSVSLNQISGFRKMRAYKPKSAIREALRHSTQLTLTPDGKRISRKIPFTGTPLVTPKVNRPNHPKYQAVPLDKPWLTKNLLKPTGFEEYATDGPITPDEHVRDREDYDAETNAFPSRLETAVTRFCARRTMHQETRRIFDRYMVYGGLSSGAQHRQFVGALSERDTEGMTKREVAAITAQYGVREEVLDGFYDDDENGGKGKWRVDFEATAKGFLSSQLVAHFDWCDGRVVATATNVLRNFFNYLLLHDVCPEYAGQIEKARMVCDVAEAELVKLKEVGTRMPGSFNKACATLFPTEHANAYAVVGDWADETDDTEWTKADAGHKWTKADAELVFSAGVFAHGSEEQLRRFEDASARGTQFNFQAISSEDMGMEITGIREPSEAAQPIYESSQFKDTVVTPMGTLLCKRWKHPHDLPADIPAWAKKARKNQTFGFLVDHDVLQYCEVGMKMECIVKQLDLGIWWIDGVQAVYPTFFTWLPNENIREWKEPGPPTEWMLSRIAKKKGRVDGGEAEEVEANENVVE